MDSQSGVIFCQRCTLSGDFKKLQELFAPPDPHEAIYERFHELSIRLLVKEEWVLEKLLDRGLTEETIIAARYGYSDERVYNKLLKEFSKEQLVESRLWLINEEKGCDFHYFGNHIIIPWMENGRYVTFQGRSLDEQAKKRYIFLPKRQNCLYHGEDLAKRGRVYLTEGAFKRDRLVQEGAHAVGLSGANAFKKHLASLRLCEDLWVILDADAPDKDGKCAGQDAALEIAKALPKCTVVTLPLADGADKIGVDDFIEEYGYEALQNVKSVTYEYGVETKPTSLSVLVSAWTERVKAHENKLGYEIGYPRFDSWLEGFHPGSLTFMAGAAHFGKTTFLEDSAARLYYRNLDLSIDYYSNDDSLFTTITRWVAKLGRLKQKDCRYPTVAFADNPDGMEQFNAATRKLAAMSDRLKILDRSYNIGLERLKSDLVKWRKENPRGEKAVFIDAFTKTKTNRDGELRDEMSLAIYKSSLLKEIAQEAHVPVIVTHEVPKLAGRRPNSWNLRGSNTLEYDADVILLFFQEAHVKGINQTELKYTYEDTQEVNPILEVIIGKDKMCGTPRTTDLFEIDKSNSRFKEVPDADYAYFMQKVRESERKEYQ